jgi:hypothetical protein
VGIWHNVTTGSEQGGGPALASCVVTLASGIQADIATSILQEAGGLRIQGAGRQTELQPSEPASATIAVDNASGAHTPGRAAATAPLSLGSQVRYRETIGRRTFDLFAGALEQPVATMGMLPTGAGDTVQATAIDWLGQQRGNARKFISNLAEWVLYHGGDTLVGYWPMVESRKPFLPAIDTGNAPPVTYDIFSSSREPVAGDAAITAASTDMPLGEDASIPTIGGSLDSSGTPAYAYHLGIHYDLLADQPTAGSGEVLTVVAWVSPVAFSGVLQEILHVTVGEIPGGLATEVSIFKDSATGRLYAESLVGSLTGTINAAGMKTGRAYPVALRWGASPAVFEVWIDRARYVGSLSGSGPTGAALSSVDSGAFASQGGFGHLQIYAGAPADYTFEDYLAQIDHVTNGLSGGLRWQRTDERLRQLLRYSGLTDAQMDLDVGVAYMPRASLAGTTLPDQVARVIATEQGRVFVGGDGTVRFHNRIRARYNF